MPTAVEAIEARVAPLLAPVTTGGKPGVGDDLSFDPEFEQVKAEIDKLGQVANVPPQWPKVAQLSAKLLSRSKDMRLGTWFAAGRMMQSSWGGLAEGLIVLRGLATTHWDAMYPERRPRARANLFAWLTEQVTTTLGTRTGPPPDRDSVLACEALFKELDPILSDKLGELYPGLGTVRSLIASSLAATAPIPAAVAPPLPTPGPPQERPLPAPPPLAGATGPASLPPPPQIAAPGATAPQASIPPVASPADVNGVLSRCRDAIVSAAGLLRAQDPTKPWAYYLQRTGIWLDIEALPRDGAIPAPPPKLREELEGHAAGMRWKPLLQEAEPLTSSFLFWFDLHRYVATALEHLGPECADAKRLVERSVASFVDRFPELPTLTFRGAVPFASPATRTWLDERRSGSSGADAAKGLLAEERAEIEKRLDAARKAVASGRVGEGIGLLIELSRGAPDGKSRFEMAFEAARMALDSGKAGLARPILDGLAKDIETHGLESWEPARCAAVYAALLSAVRASPSPFVDGTQREALIIDKLCRLDPALAVRMGV